MNTSEQNNIELLNEQRRLVDAGKRVSACKKAAKTLLENMQDDGEFFHTQTVSDNLGRRAFAIAQFVRNVEKAVKKGELVASANLDDKKLCLQTPKSALYFNGLLVGSTVENIDALPELPKHVEVEEEEEA